MNKQDKPESRAQRNIRIVMGNIKEDLKYKVVKYFGHQKEEQELAKPRYAHSQFPKQQLFSQEAESNLIDFCLDNQGLKVSKVGTLVEPMITTEEIPQRPSIRKMKAIKQPVFFTEVTTTHFQPSERPKELPASLKRSTKQQMMNKEILRRLGLLSIQAKRELEIEKLCNRALKVARIKDSPELNKRQLEVIQKQMRDAEKQSQELEIQRCTTSASAASRKAFDYQDDYLLECLSERPQLVYSVQSFRNRPQTQQTKSRIHNFFKTVTLAHLDNKDEIKKDDLSMQQQMQSIKESLQLCKKKLLDYNDEIEIALTEDIKGQVIEYKNIIKNNNIK
ncbi:unnamed protein product (macronuclear) [Paramecium tetraurelia]|uniref:Uncharacterized protein n=1 Tax=Paramecium tetraurelia TaxID=5888 RepID=A0CGT2_PARTE|nr:uncharacterized protein GSPATT00007439001 [Paramecium tetraurelia]CAK69999.1 unnamed protein product [Paramecium tetraurelia]|eukprot:XP_001437396.1 hypothetical protein (macronuclear) [Paramecium tetraurelia strain d4-2]